MLIFVLAASLSFAQARARAESESPQLRAARFALPEADAAVETARQLPNPTVTASFGGEDPQASVVLDQRLPFLGQRQRAVAAAERERPVAQAEIAQASVQLAAAIRRAYFALAAAQAGLALADESVALAQQIEQATQSRVDNGSAAPLELEEARVARQRSAQARLERAGALAQARGELAALLGSNDDALSAADPLDAEAAPPALDALLARQADHPGVAALRLESEAAESRASSEKAQVIPVPDVSIGVEHGQQAPATSVRAGIAFELPVLSWNRGRVEQAQVAAQRASAQAQAESMRLHAELRAARARWEQARARTQLSRAEQIPAAEHLLQLARTAYELGRAPLLTVLSAQGELLAARANALDAALEVQRAIADIEEAIGA